MSDGDRPGAPEDRRALEGLGLDPELLADLGLPAAPAERPPGGPLPAYEPPGPVASAPRRPNPAALLPNAITLGNALCGFGAVLALSGWTPESGYLPVAMASWLIVGAWICDMADGTVARLTGTTGRFGAALDSLCDVVGFGVAPAFLAGTLARAVGWPAPFAWGAAMLLLAGVLVRLARFDAEDVQDTGPDGHLYFRGLPSPAVGMLIASLGLTFAQAARELGLGLGGVPEAGIDARMGLVYHLGWLSPWMALLAAALAVTVVRYPDLPKHYMKRLAPRWHLLVVVVAGLGLGFGPALFVFFLLYAVLGPLSGRRRREPRRA